MRYIGHIHCPQCGIVYITDPARVAVYLHLDMDKPLAEVICENCDQTVEGTIDAEDVLAFESHGVEISEFGKKFPALTEQEIVDWNIEEDIKNACTSN